MDQRQEDKQLWITFLSCVTSVLALLSAIPNYFILIKLIKSSIQNITLLTLRSCALADVLNSVIFLIFLSPSLFTEAVVYNTMTRSFRGFFSSWMCFTLNASLLFLVVQRYTLACRMCCWRLLRDRSRICVATVWLTTGILAALQLAHSLTIDESGQRIKNCKVTDKILRLSYEVVIFFIPGMLVATGGIVLHKSNAVRCARPVKQPAWKLANSGFDRLNKPRAVGERLSTLAARALGTRMIGIETTMSFIYIAFSASLWNLIAFAFRTYGIWTESGPFSNIIMSTSHLLIFASGITRAIILLIVGRLVMSSMQFRGMQQTRQKDTRTPTETTSEIDFKSQSSTRNAFISFSLFMSPINGGLLLKTNRNRQSFWSELDNASLLSNAAPSTRFCTPSTSDSAKFPIQSESLNETTKDGNIRPRARVGKDDFLGEPRRRNSGSIGRRHFVREKTRPRSKTGVAVYSKCNMGSDSKPVFIRQPSGLKRHGNRKGSHGNPTIEIKLDPDTDVLKAITANSLRLKNNFSYESMNNNNSVKEKMEKTKIIKIKGKNNDTHAVEKDQFNGSYLGRKRLQAKGRYFTKPPPVLRQSETTDPGEII